MLQVRVSYSLTLCWWQSYHFIAKRAARQLPFVCDSPVKMAEQYSRTFLPRGSPIILSFAHQSSLRKCVILKGKGGVIYRCDIWQVVPSPAMYKIKAQLLWNTSRKSFVTIEQCHIVDDLDWSLKLVLDIANLSKFNILRNTAYVTYETDCNYGKSCCYKVFNLKYLILTVAANV